MTHFRISLKLVGFIAWISSTIIVYACYTSFISINENTCDFRYNHVTFNHVTVRYTCSKDTCNAHYSFDKTVSNMNIFKHLNTSTHQHAYISSIRMIAFVHLSV